MIMYNSISGIHASVYPPPFSGLHLPLEERFAQVDESKPGIDISNCVLSVDKTQLQHVAT